MLRLFPVLLLPLCLIATVHAEYVLTTTPDKIEIGITTDITLQCRFTGLLSSTGLYSISRLRILKESSDQIFQIVAEVRETETEVDNLGLGSAAKLTGHVGNVTSSYIAVLWDLATSDILGNYRCDIIGFKQNDDVLAEKTPVLTLVNSVVTIHDALDLSIKAKADIQQKIAEQKAYCDSKVAAAEADVVKKIWSVQNSQYDSYQLLNDTFLTQLAKLIYDVGRLKDTGVFQYWPEGSYTLLMPDSGCPSGVGAQWSTGYRRFHTESVDRNTDSISQTSHLQNPRMDRIEADNFMYQHFCVSKIRSPGPDWPRGSYCINRFGAACPSGFNSGFITWQDEVTDSKATISGTVPDGVYALNSTTIFYCCRADGPPSNPVYLPNDRPFYLFRYKGACQAVLGMATLDEYMTFDTDNSNADAYENTYHPDGNINNVRIELCYYSPQ